jgi:hypothetical protein
MAGSENRGLFYSRREAVKQTQLWLRHLVEEEGTAERPLEKDRKQTTLSGRRRKKVEVQEVEEASLSLLRKEKAVPVEKVVVDPAEKVVVHAGKVAGLVEKAAAKEEGQADQEEKAASAEDSAEAGTKAERGSSLQVPEETIDEVTTDEGMTDEVTIGAVAIIGATIETKRSHLKGDLQGLDLSLRNHSVKKDLNVNRSLNVKLNASAHHVKNVLRVKNAKHSPYLLATN